jgi:hypothetical protein
VKAFIDEFNAVDVTVHKDASGGRGLVVLYKRQNKFAKSKELYWFYGGGPQYGYWRNSSAEIKSRYGIDGVISVEYVPRNLPFCLPIEYIPEYTIGDGGGSFDLAI